MNECHWEYYADAAYTIPVGNSTIFCNGDYVLNGLRSTHYLMATYPC